MPTQTSTPVKKYTQTKIAGPGAIFKNCSDRVTGNKKDSDAESVGSDDNLVVSPIEKMVVDPTPGGIKRALSVTGISVLPPVTGSMITQTSLGSESPAQRPKLSEVDAIEKHVTDLPSGEKEAGPKKVALDLKLVVNKRDDFTKAGEMKRVNLALDSVVGEFARIQESQEIDPHPEWDARADTDKSLYLETDGGSGGSIKENVLNNTINGDLGIHVSCGEKISKLSEQFDGFLEKMLQENSSSLQVAMNNIEAKIEAKIDANYLKYAKQTQDGFVVAIKEVKSDLVSAITSVHQKVDLVAEKADLVAEKADRALGQASRAVQSVDEIRNEVRGLTNEIVVEQLRMKMPEVANEYGEHLLDKINSLSQAKADLESEVARLKVDNNNLLSGVRENAAKLEELSSRGAGVGAGASGSNQFSDQDKLLLQAVIKDYIAKDNYYWNSSIMVQRIRLDPNIRNNFDRAWDGLNRVGLGFLVNECEKFYCTRAGNLRLTFRSPGEAKYQLVKGKRVLQREGIRGIGVEFLVHPDHLDKKKRLAGLGRTMKSNNLIRRYDVVMYDGQPKLRAVDSSGRVKYVDENGEMNREIVNSNYQASSEDKCSVCLDEMQGSVLKLRGCGHTFHPRCLKLVFLTKGISCPVCRQNAQISSADVHCNRCKLVSDETFVADTMTVAPCGHVHRKDCVGDYTMALFNKDAATFSGGDLASYESRPFAKCYHCANSEGVTNEPWVEGVAKLVELNPNGQSRGRHGNRRTLGGVNEARGGDHTLQNNNQRGADLEDGEIIEEGMDVDNAANVSDISDISEHL